MNRPFVTLYIFIVFSIVSVGWGIERLWQTYKPQDDISQTQSDLMTVLSFNLSRYADIEQARDYIASLPSSINSGIELWSIDELAQSSMTDQLVNGDTVIVSESKSTSSLYKKLNDSRLIVVLHLPASASLGTLYYILIILFYLCIALAVFFWVWPLSRDLKKLQSQTSLVGKDNLPLVLDVHPGSAVFDLSVSFKSMVERIRALILSHKEMTYAVSHELRTPLARMKFALEMAADTDDIAHVKKQLLGVRNDVNDMDHLVAQLLAYAGYEQDDIELNTGSGNICEFVYHLCDSLRIDARFDNLEFEIVCEIENEVVVCEWHLMERAILNLLQNAQRFAKHKIRIATYLLSSHYVVEVEDDGPGVPEAERSRIFQSFVRLSNQENSTVRGFGLGLAIVKRILDWHKGSVSVSESSLGGAKMSLKWPILS